MPEMSLVRHPIQVLYLAHLQTESAPAMHELNQMMEELEYLVRSWDKPVLRRYRRGQEPAWTEISLPNDRTYTETFLRYMKRYNMLFAPVRDAIETDLIATENRRRMRAVSAFGTESRVMGISEGEDKISTRSTFLLFDKLTQLALVTCSRLKASVKGIEDLARDVDVEGIIVEADRLEVVLQDMPSPQRQDVLVCDKRVGEVLISGSIFDDFYTLVWPSGANFTEFLWRVQSLLSEAQPQQPLSRVGDKAFDGVLVYTESADQPIIEVPMSVPLDLNADDLFAVSRGMPVHMVRIATPLGDFFYDFTTAGKQGQRVGFMSHLPLRDLVAWAVYRTSRRRLGLTEVERVVDTILLAFSRRLNRQ